MPDDRGTGPAQDVGDAVAAPGHPPRFASAALQTYGAQLGAAVLSFVSVLIVARSLGPEGRGQVAFLTTVAVLSANVGMFGIQEANANFGAAHPELRRSLGTNSLVLAVLFGALCVGLLAPLTILVPAVGGRTPFDLRALAFVAIPLLIVQAYLTFLIDADYGFRVTNAAWLFTPLLNVVVNGILAALGVITVGTAFGSWLAGQLLATLFLCWYVGARGAGYGRPDIGLALRALRFGIKWHLGRVMMFANFRIDQWFVGAISGSRELGLYSIAVAWSEVLIYLPTALVQVQRPYLVRASARIAGARAATAFRHAIALTVIFVTVMAVAAPQLCVTVFGARFRGSIDDLRVLILGTFGIVALKQLGNALTAQRRPTLATTAAAIAFVATFALDILLIPSHGGFGAALASAISYTIGGVAVAAIFIREFKVSGRELTPRPRDLRDLVAAGFALMATRARTDTAAAVEAAHERR